MDLPGKLLRLNELLRPLDRNMKSLPWHNNTGNNFPFGVMPRAEVERKVSPWGNRMNVRVRIRPPSVPGFVELGACGFQGCFCYLFGHYL